MAVAKPVLALTCNPGICGGVGNPSCAVGKRCKLSGTGCKTDATCGAPTTGSFEDFLRLIYNLTLPGAIIAGFFFIAVAGYTLMTGQGNPDQVKKGKENLSSAIMGLVFILLSLGILRVVISTLITGSPGF